ncbi:hypothetical protein C8F01DRAFT_1368915 [Mycena amicta]|nr:hypothetical protein C8F01DRAFT_1368915 [Mycena amicta]
MDAFPPELIDYTLDFLHDDHPSLRTCSLVCRAWVHASRFRLFQHISLQRKWIRLLYPQFRAFLTLLKVERFCTFPAFVTHLTLKNLDPTPEEGEKFHYAYPILRRRLPRLASITFRNWANLGTQPLHELLPHCTRLSEIKLRGVAFYDPGDLRPPWLDTLDIMSVVWSHSSISPAETPGADHGDEPIALEFPAACSLKILRLRYCLYSQILDDFVTSAERTGARLQCRTLELSHFSRDSESTARFLASAGPALRHLILAFGEEHSGDDAPNEQSLAESLTPIDLRKNTGLQTFRLEKNRFTTDASSARSRNAVPDILRSLSAHRFLELVGFNLAVNRPDEIDNFFVWDQVDAALDAIPGLQKVECSVSLGDEEDEDSVVVRIIKRLPRMAKRGCIVFI